MVKTHTTTLEQQRYNLGGSVALALAFFYKYADELLGPEDWYIVRDVVAKASTLSSDGSNEERDVVIRVSNGDFVKVTVKRPVFLGTPGDSGVGLWSVKSAWSHTVHRGQVDWNPNPNK